MNLSIAEQFVILAINPDKGRVVINDLHFRYTLTGSLILDFLVQGEITIDNKRITPAFRKNGDLLHDMIADKMMQSKKKRKISFWIRRLTNKSRMIFRELINSLEREKILRREKKKFLNIIPYNRYWLVERGIRNKLIEDLRGILLYGKQPGKRDIMILGLVESSKAYFLLAREKGELKKLRKKNSEIIKGDLMSSEINQAIKEVQAAIILSTATGAVAASSSH